MTSERKLQYRLSSLTTPRFDSKLQAYVDADGNPLVYCEYTIRYRSKTVRLNDGNEEVPLYWVNNVICRLKCEISHKDPCPYRQYENPEIRDEIFRNEEILQRNPYYIRTILNEKLKDS